MNLFFYMDDDGDRRAVNAAQITSYFFYGGAVTLRMANGDVLKVRGVSLAQFDDYMRDAVGAAVTDLTG